MNTWENVPEGTYIEIGEHLLPVTPDYGYFVGLRDNTRAGRKAPFIGIWVASNNERFVDPVRWVENREYAEKLGQQHEQIAIWDCAKKEEVYL